MAPPKKHPSNPVAPLHGKMADLDIPSDWFDNNQPTTTFESKYLHIAENVSYALEVFEKVRVNGKGRELFKTKKEFLMQLDGALSYFEMVRPCILPDESGDLNDQREYFEKLQKAVSSLNRIFGGMHENHTRRLAHAGFVLPQHLTGEGLDNDFPQQAKNLEAATIKVRADLKGQNSGRLAELYLLIEQLADMHEDWPSRTTNEHNKNNKGAFFDLVKAIYPMVGLGSAKAITDSSIVDGIKLIEKP